MANSGQHWLSCSPSCLSCGNSRCTLVWRPSRFDVASSPKASCQVRQAPWFVRSSSTPKDGWADYSCTRTRVEVIYRLRGAGHARLLISSRPIHRVTTDVRTWLPDWACHATGVFSLVLPAGAERNITGGTLLPVTSFHHRLSLIIH